MKYVSIQTQPFDYTGLRNTLLTNHHIGGEVSFIGRVRDFSEESGVTGLTLEHYPGMTEAALDALADEALTRWQLAGVILVHRIGYLQAGDEIVLVVALSAHRSAAFEACQFLIDRLKTDVPLWKKEHFKQGERWVSERSKDQLASQRWEEP